MMSTNAKIDLCSNRLEFVSNSCCTPPHSTNFNSINCEYYCSEQIRIEDEHEFKSTPMHFCLQTKCNSDHKVYNGVSEHAHNKDDNEQISCESQANCNYMNETRSTSQDGMNDYFNAYVSNVAPPVIDFVENTESTAHSFNYGNHHINKSVSNGVKLKGSKLRNYRKRTLESVPNCEDCGDFIDTDFPLHCLHSSSLSSESSSIDEVRDFMLVNGDADETSSDMEDKDDDDYLNTSSHLSNNCENKLRSNLDVKQLVAESNSEYSNGNFNCEPSCEPDLSDSKNESFATTVNKVIPVCKSNRDKPAELIDCLKLVSSANISEVSPSHKINNSLHLNFSQQCFPIRNKKTFERNKGFLNNSSFDNEKISLCVQDKPDVPSMQHADQNCVVSSSSILCHAFQHKSLASSVDRIGANSDISVVSSAERYGTGSNSIVREDNGMHRILQSVDSIHSPQSVRIISKSARHKAWQKRLSYTFSLADNNLQSVENFSAESSRSARTSSSSATTPTVSSQASPLSPDSACINIWSSVGLALQLPSILNNRSRIDLPLRFQKNSNSWQKDSEDVSDSSNMLVDLGRTDVPALCKDEIRIEVLRNSPWLLANHSAKDADGNACRKPVMIWDDYEACLRQITQIGPSACGATAVLNVLNVFAFALNESEVCQTIHTNLRAEDASVAEYLHSRSIAGTTADQLIYSINVLTEGQVHGRFFAFYPQRKIDLFNWLSYWIGRGAVPLATLNLQQATPPGWPVADAWHHQMIYGVSPTGVHLTNPAEIVPIEIMEKYLCSDSILKVRREDIVQRWSENCSLLPLMNDQYDLPWREMNVLGQVIYLLREQHTPACSRPVLTSHISIPAWFKAGITLFVLRGSDAYEELIAVEELPQQGSDVIKIEKDEDVAGCISNELRLMDL